MANALRVGVVWLCCSASLNAVEAQAQADDYPSRPVRIVIDAPAGSSPDVSLRAISDRLAQLWGQQVLALNHPGAGGGIAARFAAAAAPDGYTLYMPSFSAFLPLPGHPSNIPLKLPADFLPIGFVADQPMMIAAAPSLGVTTVPELIALAKQRPGQIACAVSGVGRLTHLTGELLQRRAGIKLMTVPYAGGATQAIADVIGGRVALIIEGISGLSGALKAGTLTPLAVASLRRLPEYPQVPTVSQTLPGFQASGWQVLVAPHGTTDAIVQKVSVALSIALTDPALKSRLAGIGVYVRPMSPTEVTAFVRAEQQQWNSLLTELKLAPSRP